MSRSKLIPAVLGVLALAIVIGGLVWYLGGSRSGGAAMDLLESVKPIDQRSHPQGHGGFTIETVTIDGQAKKCMLARPYSRLTYQVTVPADGWLETTFAIKPDAWSQGTDGAQFRVGVSEGRNYDELLRQVIRPQGGDRRWFPVRLDLSAYQGHTVKLIFNTDPGPPGSTNAEHDEAVWCESRIVSRH